jgi:putative transposase
MSCADEMAVRKSIRLEPCNYVGFRRYFVTICCFERRSVFVEKERCGELLDLLKSESVARGFGVLAYCLMPDHLHFLAEGLDVRSDLLRFLKSFKIKSSRKHASEGHGVLWQRGFYERILRGQDTVEGVAWYIWLNPLRKGIVKNVEEYPYAGSFTGLKMPAVWCRDGWRPPWKREKNGPPRKADPTSGGALRF